MIGVVARRDQTPVVEEFFELFKTPWEFCQPGRTYDVVVATSDDIGDAQCSLLLRYGAETAGSDTRNGIAIEARHRGAILLESNLRVPLYGDVAVFVPGARQVPCLRTTTGVVGLRVVERGTTTQRFGYDLFEEVRRLLSDGQPVDQAETPTLDLHISMLRQAIVDAGLPLVEIPPSPAGHEFSVCLTHDIDFVSIRHHVFDHSMLGFLYRSTVGSVRDLLRARVSIGRALKIWSAVASLPFVYLGWMKDFWEPFSWYLRVEKGLPATYFLIPFKGRAGDKVEGRHAARRATGYDVDDIRDWITVLRQNGYELGVHGIDAWHSEEQGRLESARLTAASGAAAPGIRMHWLLNDANTARVLESAGYAYDSTSGYNETIGYRAGTGQVFRPLAAKTLLELPMHIQDGALFYAQRRDLSEAQAWLACDGLIGNASRFGGVLTLLWHDRSHGPERFWGEFYEQLVERLKASRVWFGSAGDLVGWFRKRRSVRFVHGQDSAELIIQGDSTEIEPPLTVRIHRPADPALGPRAFVEVPWNGRAPLALDRFTLQVGSTALQTPTLH